MPTMPSVLRVKSHLLKLESAGTSERVRLWRAIQEVALTAHDIELRQLEALKFPVADSEIESLTGVPIV